MNLDPQLIGFLYAVLTAGTAAFTAWLGAKYAVSKVSSQVQAVVAQNQDQSIAIQKVHAEVNGRMSEWKKETLLNISAAVEAAFARGQMAERKTPGDIGTLQVETITPERVRAKAQETADAVIATAAKAAQDVLDLAEVKAKALIK